MGILYLVPTPIGNMEDMTYRAVRILQEVDVIACEDTRRTGLLCREYNLKAPLFSYHEHNKQVAGEILLGRLCGGENIALVSDAGMPAISDPGADLITAALAVDIPVVPLPGANAGLTALVASGLDTKLFHYIGFLPRTRKKRELFLQETKQLTGTVILYEAPHRLAETLAAIHEVWGDRQAVLARELTKKYESFYRGTITTLMNHEIVVQPRGEYVLLVAGATLKVSVLDQADWPRAVTAEMESGHDYKEACRRVAKQAGVSRRDVYRYCLKAEKGTE